MAQSQLTADWTDSAGLAKTVHPMTARGCVQVFKGCLFGLIHSLTFLFVVVFHNWNNRRRWGIGSTIVKLQRIIEQVPRTPYISSNSVWSFMERELSVDSLVLKLMMIDFVVPKRWASLMNRRRCWIRTPLGLYVHFNSENMQTIAHSCPQYATNNSSQWVGWQKIQSGWVASCDFDEVVSSKTKRARMCASKQRNPEWKIAEC